MSREVIVCKLSTGEEIIGTSVDDQKDENSLFLGKVRVVALQPGPNGHISFALIPWMATAAELNNVAISRRHIIATVTDVPRQIVDAYLQQTTGIELATGKF